jgi:8-oxo-dGTP pyrophosphatase MutT (NUDIX family)
MTKNQLLSSFNLKQLQQQNNQLCLDKKLIPSAVLIPLVERDGHVYVLLTKRSAYLRHHPSQISFPGGKSERHDDNLQATALRETCEELGIVAKKIQVFGQLPSHHTVTGFHVTPFIAFVDNDYQAKINHGEVAQLFELPLREVLINSSHFDLKITRDSRQHQVYFKPTQGWPIWGITAAILEQLKRLLH